jgi:SAM-dependent methyltransferase
MPPPRNPRAQPPAMPPPRNLMRSHRLCPPPRNARAATGHKPGETQPPARASNGNRRRGREAEGNPGSHPSGMVDGRAAGPARPIPTRARLAAATATTRGGGHGGTGTMRGYRPELSFGPDTAADYDARNIRGDEPETVDFLAGLVGDGRALELAIGTGRIAVPLAARGIPVDGIELSPDMAAKLRAKPEAAGIGLTMGDFADVGVDGTYRLIYVVYNTFFNLLSQDDQVRCFQNVAVHLDPGGVFVIEAFTPDWLFRLRDHQYVDAERVELDSVTFDVARHDPVAQLLVESHVTLGPAGVTVAPIVCRYCWPSELDLMARMAGLRLISRHGGWQGEPFTADSRRHISVWGR